MRSGRLRNRVALQSPSATRDAYGGALVSWSTEATVWGGIEPLSGREYFSQQAVQAETTVRIVIRYYSGVIPGWRVTHGGLYYDIISVINENSRDRMLTLMCREGVSDDESDAANDLYDVDGTPLTFVDGETIQTVD